MSYTTTDTDAHAAIERSRSHDEIVTVIVGSEEEAYALRSALRDAADDNEETGSVDASGTLEVWGYDADSDDDSMTWRVHVRIDLHAQHRADAYDADQA